MAILLWNKDIENVYLWDNLTVEKIYKWYETVSERRHLIDFSYTWADQQWTVPSTGRYFFSVKGAGSNNAAWGLAEGTVELTEWDTLSIMVGQTWNSAAANTNTYWFGWSGNQGTGRAWWGLSWVFTWSWTILATDSARALFIWGWAGAGNGRWNGWMWGWDEWQAGQWGNYGTAWAGGKQNWRWSWGNTWANQFNGWNGSWTYWQGWWGWWRWGNGSAGDSSWDDDRNGWGWSGYVTSTATESSLTQWWWAAATQNGSIAVYQYVQVKKWIQVRPNKPSFNFYYNFAWWSLAWFQAAWWNTITTDWTYTIDSQWLKQTSWSNDRSTYVWVELPDLTNATTITLKSTWYWIRESWTNWKQIGFWTAVGWTELLRWHHSYNTNSGYKWNWIFYRSTTKIEEQVDNSTWIDVFTLTLDLTTWNVISTITWTNNLTQTTTLSSSELSDFKTNCNFACAYWGRWYSSYNGEYIKDITIEIN